MGVFQNNLLAGAAAAASAGGAGFYSHQIEQSARFDRASGSYMQRTIGTPSNVVTVVTSTDHGLQEGTPIKIKGVSPVDYNISTKVQSAGSTTEFTYLLPTFRNNLTTPGNASGATVTVETDTVDGSSPYIFNCSLRSVYGMCGMHADGSKSSGFRSMVVAQFTGVSLQKDIIKQIEHTKDFLLPKYQHQLFLLILHLLILVPFII